MKIYQTEWGLMFFHFMLQGNNKMKIYYDLFNILNKSDDKELNQIGKNI